ncbi:WD repeat-containing protein 3-like [Condylostylus longicornis]|uniref:WD repeat-containing protein 3-like n=1 Tax=Condylostylus longicornis TaxID=2530218 RepID=UPI00244D9B92|nr:WD repeat-containing protein 3-like [Condylostylus longicornis]
MEKLKKKQQRLEEIKEFCAMLDTKINQGKRTALGTTYEAEKEASLLQLQNLAIEMDELRKDSQEIVPNVSDQFQYIFTFYLKKKPSSLDYCNLNWSLLVGYGDNSIDVFTLPLDQLLVRKGPPAKITESIDESKSTEEVTLKTVHRINRLGHSQGPRSVSVSHDDGLILSLADKSIHIWNCDNHRLIHHLTAPESVTCGFFIAGNSHIVVGTSKGSLLLYDIQACTITDQLDHSHDGSVVAMAEHPKKTGFATVSTDKVLRFFQFQIVKSKDTSAQTVRCKQIGDSSLMDEGLDFSPNGKFVAVSLLDFTIQLFYADSVKLFLTLYGNKLPAPSIAISSDSTLLVSGSADKTIKIWGMDFGNIQKSWHAHDEGVTQVLFLKDTHYVVSAGKDCLVKIWDSDRRDLISQLSGHVKPVTCLAVTRLDGDRIIAGGLDRSLRVWTRTEDQIFAGEEQEKILEDKLDREAARADMPAGGGFGAQEVVMTRPTRRTVEAIKSTEQLMEAIDVATKAWKEQVEYKEALATWTSLQKHSGNETSLGKLEGSSKPIAPSSKIEMNGLSPHRYLFNVLTTLTIPLMHEVVVALPFNFAEKVKQYLGNALP